MTKSIQKVDKERESKQGAATLSKVTLKNLKTKKSKASPAIPNDDDDDDDGDNEGDVGNDEFGSVSEEESRRGSKTFLSAFILEWRNFEADYKLTTDAASLAMKNLITGVLSKKSNSFD